MRCSRQKNSIFATEKEFIEDLGEQVKEVRGNIKHVEKMAGYTKKLYEYLQLLTKAANKAGLSDKDEYDKQLVALDSPDDSPDEGCYADVLRKERILIYYFQAKKHSLLSEFYTEKAEALKLLETGVEGSDLDPKTKLDANEKDATDAFKLEQQKLWIDNNPIDKMLACIQ